VSIREGEKNMNLLKRAVNKISQTQVKFLPAGRLTGGFTANAEVSRHFLAGSFFLVFLLLFLPATTCLAWTDEQLADAIFRAEGGYRATYLYGIRSVRYKDEAEARQICLNTIRNNKRRFFQQDKYGDFLEFLASRYAPLNAPNDPKGLNRNWLKNVRYFLSKNE
jgi:hypothetical protein